MNLKLTVILCLLSAVLASAITYYMLPQKTIETTKEVIKTDVKTVVRTVKQPDGTTDTTTTIEDHSTRTETSKNQTVVARSKLSASLLVANDFSTRLFQPIYGAHVSKEILGPITVGVFGLSNATVGLSVGLNF